jgi:hypothetical protein
MAKRNNGRPANVSRTGLLRVLGTLLALALLAYLLSQQDWPEILDAFQRIPLWGFLAALALMFISRVSVSARWHVLLRSGGVKTTWQQSLRITFAGLFATNFLPTTVGGDVARLAGAIQYGFDATVSAASLIADRLIGLLGMFFILPLGLPYLSMLNNPKPLNLVPFFMFAGSGNWLTRSRRIIAELFARFFKAIRLWLSQPWALLSSLLFTFAHMVCLFGVVYVLLDGMHEPLPYLTVAGLWSLVYAVTLLPVTINGLGLQEISITFAFNHLGGVSMANSVALALLIRTFFLAASLPGALFLSGILPGMDKARLLMSKLGK